MKVLFYVQHLLGIGHLARASLIAKALVEQGAKVKMVLGGRPVAGFPGHGIEVIQLPALTAGPAGFSELVDDAGQVADDNFRKQRSNRLIAEFVAHQPDILLIEAFPFGRRQMRFELLPLLETAKAMQHMPMIACSLRDILQQRSMKRHRETVDLANRNFDAILVHGDPGLVTLEETFPLVPELAPKVAYTGIVSALPGDLRGKAHDVVVSAGGGVVGANLLQCALAAKPSSVLANASWCFLVGPNFDMQSRKFLESQAGGGVTIEGTRQDFRALLQSAKLSVSQAGYNTVADILQARCNSLLIPFAQGGESEQSLRASKLAVLGLANVLAEQAMTPAILAQSMNAAVAGQVQNAAGVIDLQGAKKTAQILADLMKSHP